MYVCVLSEYVITCHCAESEWQDDSAKDRCAPFPQSWITTAQRNRIIHLPISPCRPWNNGEITTGNCNVQCNINNTLIYQGLGLHLWRGTAWLLIAYNIRTYVEFISGLNNIDIHYYSKVWMKLVIHSLFIKESLKKSFKDSTKILISCFQHW